MASRVISVSKCISAASGVIGRNANLSLPRRFSGSILAAAAILLSGCIPYPHSVSLGPKISGVLVDNGEPVANTRIVYVVGQAYDDVDCTGKTISTITDDRGFFQFSAPKDFRFVFVMGDEVFNWSLCAEVSKDKILLWQNSQFGVADGSYVVECDLRSEFAPTRIGLDGKSRCKSKY